MHDYDLSTIAGLQKLLENTRIHLWLGFQILDVDPRAGTLSLAAPIGDNARRSTGADQAHGGIIATLIDSAATFACSAALGRPVPTMNLRVDYLRPAIGQQLLAKALIRRSGRTVALVDVDVEADGKLVAIGRCAQASSA